MTIVKHVLSSGGTLAKGIGAGTMGLARTIGWKRGLIALGVAGATIAIVRFLKQRTTNEAPMTDGAARKKPVYKRHAYNAHAAQH